MFTRSERNTLQELSLQVLGSANAYVKLIEDPQFQVVTGVKEIEEDFYYEHIPERNKYGKVRYRVIKKFYPKDKPIPKKTIPITRQMTFDEIRSALTAASELKGFQALYNESESLFYETLVDKYYDGTLINKPFLHVTEAEKPEFDKLFEKLAPAVQEFWKPQITPNAPKSGTFVVGGDKFVSELVYRMLNSEPLANENTVE